MDNPSDFVDYQEVVKSLIELLPFPIYWKDRHSRYLGCNSSFAAYAGWSTPGEVRGKTDYEMRWHDVADTHRTEDRFVMRSGAQKKGREEPEVALDGTVGWMRTGKVPLRDNSGRVIGVLGFCIDVTDLARANDAEESAVRAFAALNRLTSLLVSSENKSELVSGACKIMVDTGGYGMCCIELRDGFNRSDSQVVWAESYQGDIVEPNTGGVVVESGTEHPKSSALKIEATTRSSAEPLNHSKIPSWDARALERGYKLRMTVPLICKDKGLGTITVYNDRSCPSLEQQDRRHLSEIGSHLACRLCSLPTAMRGE